jgi:branched-chain amino acid transport system substrate-binding protein
MCFPTTGPFRVIVSAFFLLLLLTEFSFAKEIKIGMSAAFSGPTRGLGIELFRGSSAFIAPLNEQGGLFGRRLRIIAYDDGYNPDPTIRNTIRLVEEDDVFILFDYVGTPTVTRALPLVRKYGDQRNMFLFFPFTGAQPQREYPYAQYVFNLRASYRQEIHALVDYLLSIGRNRLAVFYQIDAYGRSGWEGVQKALEKRGLSLVGEATYYRGARYELSMKDQVKILRSTSPDAIICIGSSEPCAAFIRDARDGGLNVPIANVSFADSENQLQLLLATGKAKGRDYTNNLINSEVVPSYEEMNLPAVMEYRSFMEKFGAPPPTELVGNDYKAHQYSPVSLEGFLNAKLLVEILRRLGPNPQRTSIKSVVESIRDFDIGINVPVTFGPTRHQGLDAVFLTTVENGRFVSITDWKGSEK